MKINVWIYQNQQTNPGHIHRIGADGNAVGVVEILHDQATTGKEGIELKRVDPTHLPENWSDPAAQWGPNGEWLGGRGILFIYEDEYPDQDPHEIFRQYETIRSTPPVPPEVVEEVPPEGEVLSVETASANGGEAPPNKEHLPPDFPYQSLLVADGITTYGKLRKVIASGKLQEVPGIGESRAAEIEAALG